MSDQDDVTALGSDDGLPADDTDTWLDETADDGWSPVMGTPAPDAEAGVVDDDWEASDERPVAGDAEAPPPGEPPTGELGEAPPVPTPTESGLPPALPDEGPLDDPIDLSDGGNSVDGGAVAAAAPGTGVTGDTTATPPAAGDVDLSDRGVPVAPATTGEQAQSPVPAMGEQTPVPQMGGTPTAGEVDLSTPNEVVDDGPLTPEQAQQQTEDFFREAGLTEEELEGVRDPVEEGTEAEVVLPTAEPIEEAVVEDVVMDDVRPGEEQVAAAILTDAFLEEMGLDDTARDRMVDLLAESAADGTITVDELYAAFEAAGFEDTPTEGTGTTVQTVLETGDDLPRTALVRVDGEGLGMFRISTHGDVVELESLQSGSVYHAEPRAVEQAWRDSGSRVLLAAPPAAAPAPIEAPAEPSKPKAAVEEEESSNAMRNVLMAGAVLLPLAGGATFLATRKIR
jgi:hypothetical protein